MEVKKSPKADLEGKKSTWLLIGYVFILALMFVAFEWTDRDKQMRMRVNHIILFYSLNDKQKTSALLFFQKAQLYFPTTKAPRHNKR